MSISRVNDKRKQRRPVRNARADATTKHVSKSLWNRNQLLDALTSSPEYKSDDTEAHESQRRGFRNGLRDVHVEGLWISPVLHSTTGLEREQVIIRRRGCIDRHVIGLQACLVGIERTNGIPLDAAAYASCPG